jgi:hypothetical protein
MFEPRYDQQEQNTIQRKRTSERMESDSAFSRSPVFTSFNDREEGGSQMTEDNQGSSVYNVGHSDHLNAGQNTKADSSRQHDNIPPLDTSKIDKRKMKRFRLTHNQTRYLMSEFARQAHPDASHRDRLSREIPGLSPRQVQVWFQNRRAKLKRMSSDDRDRMMRSRALPEEFPLLQTLHSYGTSKLSENHSPIEQYHSKHVEMKPMGYHSLPRHISSDNMPMNSSQGQSFAPHPFTSPRTAGGLPSPISTTSGDRPSLPYLHTPTGPKPIRGNPFSSPPGRDSFRQQTQSMSQPPSVPRTFSEMSNHLPGVQTQSYSSSNVSSDNFQHDSKGFYLHSHSMGLPRSLPGNELGQQNSYISTTSPSMSQPYPSPHKPSFSTPLNLMTYKYQMPMTPQTAGASSFSEQSLHQSPELVSSLPQQLSAPADATTFTTSYLTSTPSHSSYSQDGLMSPKTATSKDSSFGRWYGHRSRRSCSHPPEFLHAATSTVS